MPRWEVWQWLAAATALMALGWFVAIVVWEPLGLLLVFVALAVCVVTVRRVGDRALDEARRQRRR